MKEVNSYGWKAVIGSSIGYAMDGFDLLILGFMLTLISGDLGLTTGQAGSLVTWTLVGAVLGGFIFGTLSDKFGRVRVLTWDSTGILVFLVACRRVGSFNNTSVKYNWRKYKLRFSSLIS